MTDKTAFELARGIVSALEDKKAEDIILIDISEVAVFTDYFIICSGTSDRMLRSLIKAATEAAVNNNQKKGRVLGSPEHGWVVVDFGDVVLHVFSPEQRDYYQLEELWVDGRVILKIK